ncbi:hypothetical protein [Streptomyces zagrosensis]|uniref:hypothetical protein n=1 Tax=Streptomyces zagrosensis TaxID=1042984 RepID=UPI0028B1AA88|nr:hypothetical protein [Streptomyces zagrosensis]
MPKPIHWENPLDVLVTWNLAGEDHVPFRPHHELGVTEREDNAQISVSRDGAYYRVRAGALEMLFLPGPNEALDEVCNVDAEVRLPDGSRWSATIFTVAEVERLMTRWVGTGEALSGRYFWCSGELIVKEPGVIPMAKVIMGLLDNGEFHRILQQLDDSV